MTELTTWGSLPAVRIGAADGASALVTLYGGHLVSWRSADGREHLFCSARSAMDGSRAIRGGVPLIFPQFAERGDGMRHGFARVSTWRLDGSGQAADGAFARFTLTQADLSPALAAAWPHGFALTLRVALQANTLALAFEVNNTGSDAFAFSSALHSYLAVHELAAARISGLPQGELAITDKLDQIVFGIDGPVTLRQAGGALRLAQSGFTDAVVWNPGAADTAALADLDDQEYRRFICIEAALITPMTLAPGQSWRGEHTLSAIG